MANRMKGQWKRKRRVESYPVSSTALAPTCYVHRETFEYLLNDAKSHYSRYIFIVRLRNGCRMSDLCAQWNMHMRASIRAHTHVSSKNWIWNEMDLRSRCRCDDNNDNDERNRNKPRTKRAADEKICWGAPHRLMDYPFERISCSQNENDVLEHCARNSELRSTYYTRCFIKFVAAHFVAFRHSTAQLCCWAHLLNAYSLHFRARGRTNFDTTNNFQLRMQNIHFTRCGIRRWVCMNFRCVRTSECKNTKHSNDTKEFV